MAGKQGIVQLDLSALNEALDKIKSFGGKVDDLASGNNLPTRCLCARRSS